MSREKADLVSLKRACFPPWAGLLFHCKRWPGECSCVKSSVGASAFFLFWTLLFPVIAGVCLLAHFHHKHLLH